MGHRPDSECQRACEWLAAASYSFMDQGRYDECAELFASDAVWIRGGKEVVGRSAIRGALGRRSTDQISRHLVTNIVVKEEGPTRAQASALFVPLRSPAVTNGVAKLAYPEMVGDLSFAFRKIDGVWLISRLHPKPVLVAPLGEN